MVAGRRVVVVKMGEGGSDILCRLSIGFADGWNVRYRMKLPFSEIGKL